MEKVTPARTYVVPLPAKSALAFAAHLKVRVAVAPWICFHHGCRAVSDASPTFIVLLVADGAAQANGAGDSCFIQGVPRRRANWQTGPKRQK